MNVIAALGSGVIVTTCVLESGPTLGGTFLLRGHLDVFGLGRDDPWYGNGKVWLGYLVATDNADPTVYSDFCSGHVPKI